MTWKSHRVLTALSLIATFSLGGCITASPVQDPQTAVLAEAISSESGRYFALLTARAAPGCDYEHNMNEYARLGEISAQLTARLADRNAGAALMRAGHALSRTIELARISHQRASARTGDTNGACMAPGAITLNADAVARASRAIASTQITSGGQ